MAVGGGWTYKVLRMPSSAAVACLPCTHASALVPMLLISLIRSLLVHACRATRAAISPGLAAATAAPPSPPPRRRTAAATFASSERHTQGRAGAPGRSGGVRGQLGRKQMQRKHEARCACRLLGAPCSLTRPACACCPLPSPQVQPAGALEQQLPEPWRRCRRRRWRVWRRRRRRRPHRRVLQGM